MRVRVVGDGDMQFPATPRIERRFGLDASEDAANLLGKAPGRTGLAAYLEAFSLGWVCGFTASAGLFAVFLNH